jgi:hypothetical protein
MSVLNLISAFKEKMRAERSEQNKPIEDELVSFEKLPEISRLEDMEVGALLNK